MFSSKQKIYLDDAFVIIATIQKAVASQFCFFFLFLSNNFLLILLQLLSMKFVSANNKQTLGLALQSFKILDSLPLITRSLNQCCPIFNMTTYQENG